MERVRQRHGSADYRAAQGIMRQVFVRFVNESYGADLAELRCPVELVWGEDDTDVPVEVARSTLALCRERSYVVSGAGHLTPLTVPGELRAAVERVLARRDGPGAVTVAADVVAGVLPGSGGYGLRNASTTCRVRCRVSPSGGGVGTR